MNKKIIGAVVFVVLLVGVVVFVKWEKQNTIPPPPFLPPAQDEQTPPNDLEIQQYLIERGIEIEIEKEQSEAQEIDISDWKVYRNEEYGFEIKYPQEFGARDSYGADDFIYPDANRHESKPIVDFNPKDAIARGGASPDGVYIYIENRKFSDTKIGFSLLKKTIIDGRNVNFFVDSKSSFVGVVYEMSVDIGDDKVLVFISDVSVSVGDIDAVYGSWNGVLYRTLQFLE